MPSTEPVAVWCRVRRIERRLDGVTLEIEVEPEHADRIGSWLSASPYVHTWQRLMTLSFGYDVGGLSEE